MRYRKTKQGTFSMTQVLSYKNLHEDDACLASSAFYLVRFSNNWKNGGINPRGGIEKVMSKVNMIHNNCTFFFVNSH